MNRLSRITVLILSVSLIAGYLFPIWSIDLEAPQYPEGLGMEICINKLTGDINTINGLNHYIGMQKIDEGSIPELVFMPYLLGIIIVMGIAVSVIGKKWLLYSWVILFALLGIAGGIDFYLWEYDYGHNLDPRAAIQIPGMYYQPPLFGSKELLNFIAHSYPAIGGWTIIIAGLLAVALMLYNLIKKPSINIKLSTPVSYKKDLSKALVALLAGLGFFLTSCSPKAEPIAYGKDMCNHCKMKIMDERFGAELVTKQGKVYKFDAIECLVSYHHELEPEKKEKVWQMLVADASNKGSLVVADAAYYLHSDNFPSPMSANISGYAIQADAQKFHQEYQGSIISWLEVKSKILSPGSENVVESNAAFNLY